MSRRFGSCWQKTTCCLMLLATFGWTPRFCEAAPPHEHVFLAGVNSSQLSDRLQGLVLLEELNCVACHATDSALAKKSKVAPRLGAVGSRVNPYYLEQFLQAPHDIKPGTTMPDVMSHLSADVKRQTAKSLTHYLLSLNSPRAFALEAIDTVAAEQGETLYHTVGCVACHAPRNAQGQERLAGDSVPLPALEKKYNTSSLAEFLRAPHTIRPSSRMPDLRLSGREASQIANYLLRKTQVPGNLRYTLLRGKVWEGLEVNVTKELSGLVSDFSLERFPKLPDNSAIVYEGYLKIDEPGEYTFEVEFNGGELWLDGDKVLDLPPSNRRGVKVAQTARNLTHGMHEIKFVYIHTGKEPSLRLEMKGPGFPQQAIPAERLSISARPIEPFKTYAIDKTLVEEGQRHFATLGCANCHNDVKVEPSSHQPLSRLDIAKGCLSNDRGAWPHYALSAKQKNLLRAALPQAEKEELEPREVVNKTLVTFNCIACHNREDLGGVSPQRNEYFTGTKKELGNEGRIPPPLTLVGAKLQPQWMREVMLHGKTQREYLATRMPQFGEANVGHLIELFEQVDKLEAANFAKIEDLDRYKSAGHKLIGTTGLSCIACHDFNGQKAGGPGALDIVNATERVKKDWFYWFLLDPARFHPGTIMPASWPEGHVFKTDILDGDAKKQIESLWIYLEDGRRAKNPEGLSRKSPELRVTDEPVICRGRGAVGYRGIAVGYPERVSLVFDAEEMSLRTLWKGDFVTTNENSYSIRGQDQIQFPPGIPFHRLASLEDNWPYKRPTDYLFPHDHGYQFRGYFLDKQKRPTFMYRYGEIEVEDFFEDRLDDQQQAYLRRTLTFKAPEAQEKFYLRAAAGERITSADKSASSFAIDRLRLAIQEPHTAIVREGDPAELLIPLELPAGKSTVILNYQW